MACDVETKQCFGVGHEILGIDIGGTSIKAAVVDTVTGELISERHVVETPQPATPESVAIVIKAILDHFSVTCLLQRKP